MSDPLPLKSQEEMERIRLQLDRLGNDTLIPGGNRPHNGSGNPPGGDDMEQRVSRLEAAFEAVRGSLTRIEGRLDRMEPAISGVVASQARLEERMERVMDKARDMPTESRVNSMLNHKLTILGIISAVIVGLVGLLK